MPRPSMNTHASLSRGKRRTGRRSSPAIWLEIFPAAPLTFDSFSNSRGTRLRRWKSSHRRWSARLVGCVERRGGLRFNHLLPSDQHDSEASATLELAVMVYQPNGGQTAGIQFELLRTYPLCVAMTATHPFARLKSITLEKLAAEPLVGLRRKDYSEYYRIVDRVFASVHAKPRIAVECDSASSLITEVEAGRGVALSSTIFKLVAGKRLLYRPLTGTTEVASVGIARASKGDVTPAGEKFCEILRKISNGATASKSKPARSSRTKFVR